MKEKTKDKKKEKEEEKDIITMKVKPTILRQLRELAGFTQEQILQNGIDINELE